MTTRTIQITGSGFGSSPATVIATLNGNTVFNGTVPTINLPVPQPVSGAGDLWIPLFTFEIPMDFVGNVPMTCETTNSTTVVFASIFANYSNVWISGNAASNTAGHYETCGPNAVVDVLTLGQQDPRNTTTLNGQTYIPDRSPTQQGTWWWTIPQNTVLGYNLEIAQAGNIGTV